jgi:hypothetical protein
MMGMRLSSATPRSQLKLGKAVAEACASNVFPAFPDGGHRPFEIAGALASPALGLWLLLHDVIEGRWVSHGSGRMGLGGLLRPLASRNSPLHPPIGIPLAR